MTPDEARLRELPKLTVELVRHYGTMNMRKWSGGGDFEPGTHVMIPLCLAETILANALLAERERGDRAYTAAADYCEFYADERMTLCGDTILHDPLLKGGDFTVENMVKSQELNIDGTINSAAYHAAMNLAAHFRTLATQKAEGAEA